MIIIAKGKVRTVYRTVKARASKRYSSAGGFKGIAKGILPNIGAGVVDSYLDPMLPIDGVGSFGIGFFFKNPFLMNLGGYKIGYSLGNILPLPGKSSGSTGVLL